MLGPMKTLACERCGMRVFFENVACERCGAALGFVPDELTMGAFEPRADGPWQRLREGAAPRQPCRNYVQAQACNWMLPAGDAVSPYCLSCRTTEIVPALDKAENQAAWARIELAKRRVVYSLLVLRLPVRSRTEDPAHGLSFRFLEELTPAQPVTTGHDNGVITLNIEEADDARREAVRHQLHEPYRTLVGHFRHETGHYYWDRLVDGTPWLERFRALFGDERADYAQALQAHYEAPRTDWPERFVSAYASSHPWEDWAECWAHYLHILDGLETAAAWGLKLASPGGPPVTAKPLEARAGSFAAALVERWLPISRFVNAMSRSLGLVDGYPFVIPPPVVEKLDFVHQVVASAGRPAGRGRARTAAAPATLQGAEPCNAS